jgi:beta-lactamase superfamily II metal-dependent hydrolase
MFPEANCLRFVFAIALVVKQSICNGRDTILMPSEIDFLKVGDGERSGDAIALRFWNQANPEAQTVLVLDGGTKESGSELVSHITTHYKTDVVNAVICTHSDADHASGLTEVLENLDVKRLLMHLPWNHVADIEENLKKASATDDVRQHFRKSLENAHELENLAKKKGISIVEPFSDKIPPDDVFAILGPSTAFYESQLKSFRCVDELELKDNFWQEVLASLTKTAEKAITWVDETWGIETLSEPGDADCSAENNSSVILLFSYEGRKFLFTSDAGVPALTDAANYAYTLDIDLKALTGIQIPHHGSKHNVGPKILDRIVGPKLGNPNAATTKSAIVSAAKEGAPKHPSRRVVNAFKRRGAKIIATQGISIVHRSPDAPGRDGWSDAEPLPFYDKVEE